MKLSDLKINQNNPQKFNDLSKLENSLKEFPKMLKLRPLVIDNNNMVLGGNKRLICLRNLGFKEIPDEWVVKASELTEDEKKRFIIADNVGFGEWDWELLKDWDSDNLESWGLELDFENKELETEEDNYNIEDTKQVDVVLGDLIEIGEHRLMCGDSTDSEQVAKLMNGEKADLYITDPPYSVNFTKKSNEIFKNKRYNEIKNDNLTVNETAEKIWRPTFKNVFDVSIDECSFYVTMPQGGDQMMMMMMMMSVKWKVKHELIWVKEAPVFSMGRLDYDYKHEPIMYGWKNKHNFYGKGKFLKSIWEIPRTENKLHPTMKPVALIENCLLNSSKKENIIIDTFLGSGSTMVASHQLKRKCYGMELDPMYCQVIIDRMYKLDNSLEIKINGKEYIPNI